jgi:hypothetical protein
MQRDAQDSSLARVGKGLVEQKISQAVGYQRAIHLLNRLEHVRPLTHDQVRSRGRQTVS